MEKQLQKVENLKCNLRLAAVVALSDDAAVQLDSFYKPLTLACSKTFPFLGARWNRSTPVHLRFRQPTDLCSVTVRLPCQLIVVVYASSRYTGERGSDLRIGALSNRFRTKGESYEMSRLCRSQPGDVRAPGNRDRLLSPVQRGLARSWGTGQDRRAFSESTSPKSTWWAIERPFLPWSRRSPWKAVPKEVFP